MELLWFISGIVLGAVLAYFIVKYQNQSSGALQQMQMEKQDILLQLNLNKNEKESLKDDLLAEKKELQFQREKNLQITRQLAGLESDYKNLQEKLQEQKSELKSIQEQFKNEFKNLAQDIFEEKSKKFTDQNKTNIGELLNPLKDKIEKFEERAEKTSKENLLWNSALKDLFL